MLCLWYTEPFLIVTVPLVYTLVITFVGGDTGVVFTDTEDQTAAIIIKITGTNANAAANDCIGDLQTVNILK